MSQYLLQAPGETLDYSVDWTNELNGAGDTIITSTWSISPSGAGLVLSGAKVVGQTASTKVAGLTFGGIYRLTNVCQTDQGLVLERSLTIRCHKR